MNLILSSVIYIVLMRYISIVDNKTIKCTILYLQSDLSYMTFQWNNEIYSHKTGGHLIQV